jgi:hypothetical protein
MCIMNYLFNSGGEKKRGVNSNKFRSFLLDLAKKPAAKGSLIVFGGKNGIKSSTSIKEY